jgi:glycosyltransferase involved in cell wall biosynthesis
VYFLKILFVSDVYFPRINGVSRSIQILRQELHKQGHQTILVSPDYNGLQSVIFDSNEKILRIPARKILFDPEDRLMKDHFLKNALQYLIEEFHQFDVIHVHTPFQAHRYGIKWARQLKIPVIETYHTYFEEYFHCYISFLPRFLLSWLARKITQSQCMKLNQLIVPSLPIQEVIRSYGIDTPIKIIPTGLNNDDFFTGDGEIFKKYYEIDSSRPIIMYVGRVAHEKNIEFLLQVTSKLLTSYPELLFIIAGEGPATAPLLHRISELQINNNVRFVGYLSRKNMLRHCYAAGDVFVFASRTETQGLVLLEAMAQGVPVVSTAELGTKDILVDGNGCLIAEENIDDFSQKVFSLLKDDDRRHQLGLNAKLHAAEYSSCKMVDDIVSLYCNVTATQNPDQLAYAQQKSG